jgi:hypothetical protein
MVKMSLYRVAGVRNEDVPSAPERQRPPWWYYALFPFVAMWVLIEELGP